MTFIDIDFNNYLMTGGGLINEKMCIDCFNSGCISFVLVHRKPNSKHNGRCFSDPHSI